MAGWLKRVEQIGMPVRYILSAQRERSAGINRGLEQTRTWFVAITHDDRFVEVSWLSNMADKLRQHLQAVITGSVEAAGQYMVLVVISLTPFIQHRPRLKFDSMSGGNMVAALDILARAAGHFGRALRRWVRGTVTGKTELAMLGKAYCLNLLAGIKAGMRSMARPGSLQ